MNEELIFKPMNSAAQRVSVELRIQKVENGFFVFTWFDRNGNKEIFVLAAVKAPAIEWPL
jgi:hypothetical protein